MAASFPDLAILYRGGILRIGLIQRIFLDPILQRRGTKTGDPTTRNPALGGTLRSRSRQCVMAPSKSHLLPDTLIVKMNSDTVKE